MHHRVHTSTIRRIRPLRMLGCCALACGLALCVWQAVVRSSYRRLAKTTSPLLVQDAGAATNVQPGAQATQRDWDYLQDCNGSIAAWVSVEGTSIDLPVVSPAGRDSGYFLTHDFWGRWALEGTPYLDERCQADGMHRLVFGHHLASGGQFSELQKAYEAQRFQELGPCRWETPHKPQLCLLPLCSMRVDASYQPIQTFGFSSSVEMRAWLLELASQASARSPSWQERASAACSALTLVTCASDRAGQRARTLVIFVEVSEE